VLYKLLLLNNGAFITRKFDESVESLYTEGATDPSSIDCMMELEPLAMPALALDAKTPLNSAPRVDEWPILDRLTC